jgi:hypothetical protein
MFLTLEKLEGFNACASGLRTFKQYFPDGVDVTKDNVEFYMEQCGDVLFLSFLVDCLDDSDESNKTLRTCWSRFDDIASDYVRDGEEEYSGEVWIPSLDDDGIEIEDDGYYEEQFETHYTDYTAADIVDAFMQFMDEYDKCVSAIPVDTVVTDDV